MYMIKLHDWLHLSMIIINENKEMCQLWIYCNLENKVYSLNQINDSRIVCIFWSQFRFFEALNEDTEFLGKLASH